MPNEELRRRAQARLKTLGAAVVEPGANELVVELQLHEAELELQNQELHRAQAELQVSHDRYFTLFEMAPVAYLTVGPRGVVLAANPAALDMLGIAADRLLGTALPIFVDPADIYRFHRHQQALLGGGGHQ